MAEVNITARQAFSPSCPVGGTWWACGYGTYFVGCCARDPCEITCAQGNLYPGAFDPKAYGTFPDATCGTGSKFYTCTAGLTFWGCCKTNPCAQSGCPDGDLEAAILNRDDIRSAYHATGGSTTISSASSTSTPSSSVTPSLATPSSDPDSGISVAAIAGGAAGGALALAAIVGIIVWCLCFKKKKKGKGGDDAVGGIGQDGLPVANMTEPYQQHARNKSGDAPPSYTSPNPNFNSEFYTPSPHSIHNPAAAGYPPYAHQHQQDPYFSPIPNSAISPHNTTYAHHYATPQELAPSTPLTPKTPAQFRNHKSMYGHARGPSELSGDEPMNELETGVEVAPEIGSAGIGAVGVARLSNSSLRNEKEKEKMGVNGQQQQQQQQQEMVERKQMKMQRYERVGGGGGGGGGDEEAQIGIAISSGEEQQLQHQQQTPHASPQQQQQQQARQSTSPRRKIVDGRDIEGTPRADWRTPRDRKGVVDETMNERDVAGERSSNSGAIASAGASASGGGRVQQPQPQQQQQQQQQQQSQGLGFQEILDRMAEEQARGRKEGKKAKKRGR